MCNSSIVYSADTLGSLRHLRVSTPPSYCWLIGLASAEFGALAASHWAQKSGFVAQLLDVVREAGLGGGVAALAALEPAEVLKSLPAGRETGDDEHRRQEHRHDDQEHRDAALAARIRTGVQSQTWDVQLSRMGIGIDGAQSTSL